MSRVAGVLSQNAQAANSLAISFWRNVLFVPCPAMSSHVASCLAGKAEGLGSHVYAHVDAHVETADACFGGFKGDAHDAHWAASWRGLTAATSRDATRWRPSLLGWRLLLLGRRSY